MQATLFVLLIIQIAFAKEFSRTKVLQASDNITLDYEVADGMFLFKLSALANKATQLGIIFSEGVRLQKI